MKKILALSLLLAFTTPAFAQQLQTTVTTQLSCMGGVAAAKKYGGYYWLVSTCNDGKSLAFVASEGNPAKPYTIISVAHDAPAGRSFSEEGTGDKAAADAALAEIKNLSDQDIAALIAQSKGGK